MTARLRTFLFWSLPAVLFLFMQVPAQAKHLVGGSISYKYIGRSGVNNKLYKYRVTITVYRDASGGGPQFDNPITIGVYDNTGSKPLIQSFSVSPASEVGKKVNPVSAGTPCKDMPSTDMYETTYTTDIELEGNSTGYHVIWQRCCRNNQVNLPDNEGQTYDAFIPATSILNTSPTFSEVPVPYVCANDTTELINTASEPDGDSLSYELVWPYAGGSDQEPIPGLPNFYPSPLPLVQYNNGFTYTKPFGPGGYASINKVTGVTKIYSTIQGRFALALDVKEYRNGKLISTTRRDIQIIVTSCKPSNPPKRQPVGGIIQSNYEVIAGDTLSIPLSFTSDDTLRASASGEIFDPTSGITPLATIDKTIGRYSLSPTITWNTDCNHARSQPYIVNVKVWNNACPPKTINTTLTITVKPFKQPNAITGRSPACVGEPGELYSALRHSKTSKLLWKVSNGTIVTYPSANEVLVVWKTGAQGEIKVVEVSDDGCFSDTVKRTIIFNPRPVTSGILGDKISCVNAIKKYSVVGTSGSQYYWFVTGGYINSGNGNSQVDIRWSVPGKAMVKVIEIDKIGCRGDTVRLPVTIGTPSITKVYGSLSVCPNAKGIDYWVDAQDGSTYIWNIVGGSQASGGSTSHITINWGSKGGGIVKVVERTKDGCFSDTVRLQVTKDYILATPAPEGDTSVCAFMKGVVYQVINSNGSTYNWGIVGGTIVSGAGTATITVDWGDAGTGYIAVTETAYDPINNMPCTGVQTITRVEIHPLPKTSPIHGPTEICQGDKPLWYVEGYESSIFKWAITNGSWTSGASMPYGVGEDSTSWPNWARDSVGTFTLMLWELTEDSCSSPPQMLKIVVHPQPEPKKVDGPTVVCLPQLDGHVYSITADPANTYEWEIDGGSIVGGLGTNQVTVNWELAGVRQVRVREKSSFGCLGPWNRLNVNVDSLALEIDYVTTSRGNDKQIEVHYRIKNSQFINRKIKIYRSRSSQDGYTLLDSVDAGSSLYIDRKVETGKYSYYYYLAAENLCGTTIFSPRHRSILASGDFDGDTTMNVHWNPYEGWPGGVDYYHVWQSINDDTTLNYYSLTKSDSFMDIIDNSLGWKQCYRVAAVKAQDNSIISWSNKVCFDFEPILWVPNVFTPDNRDAVNNTFRPSVIHYRTYEVTIYNRWGERIFYSNDPMIQWDGTYKGKPVPEGIYLYMIGVKGITTRIYKNGTVQVMR